MTIYFKKFKEIKKNARNYYQSIDRVWCPYFTNYVHFNSKGFEHILFKSKNRPRNKNDCFMRLKYLKLAPQILSQSHTLQEFTELNLFVKQKINSRWERKIKTVKYYAFIAIIDEVRFKIIVEEVTGGGKFFYSIIPYWKIGLKNKKRILYSGELDKD